MDCQQARENILDALAEPLAPELRRTTEAHTAACPDCAAFARLHQRVDARLSAGITASSLSPAFRASLKARMRRDADSAWPDFLPDLAHLIGCALAILASLVVFQPGAAILLGLAFTAVTYFLQAVVRDAFE